MKISKKNLKIIAIFSIMILNTSLYCSLHGAYGSGYIGENNLLDAAFCNDIAKVKRLIEARVNVDARGASVCTPLMLAIEQNHTDMAKILIDNGANVNCANERGRTALITVARDDNICVASMLIGKGSSINATDNNGDTALIYAAERGRTEMVKLLLASRASVNVVGNLGETALSWTIDRNNLEIAKLLMRAGANINEAAKGGSTFLMRAVCDGRIDIIELLLRYGADYDLKDKYGKKAIDLARDLIRAAKDLAKTQAIIKLLENEPPRRIKVVAQIIVRSQSNFFPLVLANIIGEYAVSDYKDIIIATLNEI